MSINNEVLKSLNFERLPQVQKPKYVVFCDFDETYYSHNMDDSKRSNMKLLEKYLYEHGSKGDLVIGWVTGSSLESIVEKMKRGGIQYFPHFVASGLGTEITYFDSNGTTIDDQIWEERIIEGGFDSSNIERILKLLELKYEIFLRPQTQLGSSKYKFNFYYEEQNEFIDAKNLEKIEEIGEIFQVGVNINKCNPLAGDPENCYDVDFIPLGTGKDEIVKFILDKYELDKTNAIAFGDSGNDLRMLQAVRHGYLVENATEEAKNTHSMLAQGEYSIGILNTLKHIIN
ncbi:MULTISPECIES: HAD-IIB family hydrolase [Bacillus]|uniref:HAD hydrolase, family IIB n=1 Tax=Bacillus wiedmannii TaxID=1890302 RepID=A0AB37YT24_9BACI|nr:MULTISPECIES: HAD-IIB family hydrolase [Bacillus]EJS67569.1 HAD hydrolase, family IIB [Bacillus wiedmannii]EJV65455.1 HAD hydrolase, family IIB [Bacillus wiedmannii]OFC93004.1 Kanosamine-6-phosphate phosphatase [Bacillus wiedmannii]PEA44936.1 HAD family hydrolase [Bacillus wiedmannii]PEU21555.1 HAD family hydrolase [Bacillus wiedmannii]